MLNSQRFIPKDADLLIGATLDKYRRIVARGEIVKDPWSRISVAVKFFRPTVTKYEYYPDINGTVVCKITVCCGVIFYLNGSGQLAYVVRMMAWNKPTWAKMTKVLNALRKKIFKPPGARAKKC